MTAQQAAATSMKIDFLDFGHVRTDPIIAPTTLSDHVHTFYGATVARPETTYQDLRSAYGGTGTAVENQSLYWHPTIYKVDPDGTKRLVNMYIGSAYYIWTPGVTRAFPNGFKMIAFAPESEAAGWFPQEPTEELETSLWFPDCWDGINVDSPDHMSHVAYSSNRDVDGICPPSHPVKIPKIEFFVRVSPYEGGQHVFSDGTTRMHADYFSGWEETFLQTVLDGCDNGSFFSADDQFCENFVSFKDLPKVGSSCGTLASNLAKVQAFQPPPLDMSTITDEAIDGVVDLPRGEGTGTLKPPGPVATLPPRPTLAPIPINCGDNTDGGDDGGSDEGNGDGGGDGEGDEGNGSGDGGEDGGDEGEGNGDGDNGGDEDNGDEGDEMGDGEDEVEACEDSDEPIYISSRLGGHKSCSWLSRRPALAARLCNRREYIAEACLETCGLCS